MDLKELKEILQILEEKEITEFELEEEGMKLRIRKAVPPPPTTPRRPRPPLPWPPLPRAPPAAPPPPAAAAAPAPPAAAAAAEAEAGLTVVKSPIVGTFYRTPDPNSPPFVNVGDRVRVGQVLCIIEAMKLMNEIEAEVAGEIVEGPPRERPARAVRRAALHHPALTAGRPATDVQEDPDRQPGRDRAPRDVGLQGARHQDGRRLLRGRPRQPARALRRPGGVHRARRATSTPT